MAQVYAAEDDSDNNESNGRKLRSERTQWSEA